MTDAILAIDLGTSSIKAVLVSLDGIELDQVRLPHAILRPSGDAAEQDPNDWWDHTCRIISTIGNIANDPATIVAISITGQMHGLVLRDANGSTLGNAITWQDQRSATTLPSLLARLPTRRRHDAANVIAPGFLVTSWDWIHKTDPRLAGRVAQVSLPKDHIIYCLTGRHVTDPTDAVGTGLFDTTNGSWDRHIADAAELPVSLLPEILPSGTMVGPVRPEIAGTLGLQHETPVIVAGGDAAVAAFGAGVVQPDQELMLLSSGCQIIRPADQAMVERTEGVLTWPAAVPTGLPAHLAIATLLNGGDAISWAKSQFQAGPETRSSERDWQGILAPRLPVFVPWLGGERHPEDAPVASGAFFGLGHLHSSDQLLEAVVDGVTLALLDRHLHMGGAIGCAIPIRLGGGGIHQRAWLDAIAHHFARPLTVMATSTLSGWGAARLAATTLGLIDPITDPDAWLPKTSLVTPHEPDPQGTWARLETFRQAASFAVSLTRLMPT